MSTGASKAASDARIAAGQDRTDRMMSEDKLKREKLRSQNLFIRQLRAQQQGGIFNQGLSDTLG